MVLQKTDKIFPNNFLGFRDARIRQGVTHQSVCVCVGGMGGWFQAMGGKVTKAR